MRSIDLKIGGIAPLTSRDFPGKWSAVLFLQGCPWRCLYCHNPHLWNAKLDTSVSWEKVEEFLMARRRLLDAVVFSGGEPTMQKNLFKAIQRVRDMGFKVGLHTGGAFSNRLKELLPFIDWVGFDVKAPFAQYEDVTQRGGGKQALESAKMVLQSQVAYEFRTTIHPSFLKNQDLLSLAKFIQKMGVSRYVLQKFRAHGCQNLSLNTQSKVPYPDPKILQKLNGMFTYFELRKD